MTTATEMHEEYLKLVGDRRRVGLFCAACDKTSDKIENFEEFNIKLMRSGETLLVCNICEETIPC